MKDDLLEHKIHHIEEQLKELKQQVNTGKPKRKKRKGFAGLEDIWSGKVHITDEEIEAARIRGKAFPE